MACLERLGTRDAGSQIGFTIRPDADGLYPDISDMTATIKVVYSGSVLLEFSIGSPTPDGSAVTLESDVTSQFISVNIKGSDTEGLVGDIDIYSHLDSIAYGARTEGKGSYRICEVI
jgi:hypothetical protein